MKTIEPVPGEPLRFWVRSRSELGVKRLVDLQYQNWNGWCGCQDFEFHRLKVLRENHNMPSDRSRCWHIRVVREWLMNRLLRDIALHIGAMEQTKKSC
jgi:hypothetical protein